VTTVDYLLGQALPPKEARAALQRLLDLFEIAPVNRPVLEQALRSGISDFENAVIEQSARLVAADAITTRNLTDFEKSSVTAFDPPELLSAIAVQTKPAGPTIQVVCSARDLCNDNKGLLSKEALW